MIKTRLSLLLLLLSVYSYSQITIIGHNKLNNEPVKNTFVLIKGDGVATRTLNTGASSDFLIKLEFGKNYRIFFQNAKSPVIFLEVIANTVPEDKYSYKMLHELNVPFFDSNDDDIDTTIFKEPIQRIIFDGKTKMVEDSVYNIRFRSRILKPMGQNKQTTRSMENPVIIAGQVLLNSDPKLTVNNKTIQLLNKKGQILKSTSTNRFGCFYFTGINPYEVAKLKMEIKESVSGGMFFTLINSKSFTVSISRPENTACNWDLNQEDVDNLTDNNFTTNIGGELVVSAPKMKKFFANKTVYLSNKFNTIIQKTTTNVLGTFVFENVKPDNIYFLGVDKFDLASGERIDVLNKDEKFVASLDTLLGGKASCRLMSNYNKKFNDLSISDAEMTMSVKATIYGDNINNPIGKLKVILLNDAYQVMDSAVTDDFGAFKFKYLPFLKRFYLSAENSENILDVYNNILIYNKDYNLVKIMTHEKGSKFSYKPVNAEIFRLREVELEDPWLEFVGNKKTSPTKKIITESILFESGDYTIQPEAKEILDKVVLVLKTNKKIKIEIGAHTDSKGSEEDNLKLSEQRAKSVLNYILSAGIDRSRVVCKGYGESKLLNNCGNDNPCTEQQHARNRRIEFTILEE